MINEAVVYDQGRTVHGVFLQIKSKKIGWKDSNCIVHLAHIGITHGYQNGNTKECNNFRHAMLNWIFTIYTCSAEALLYAITVYESRVKEIPFTKKNLNCVAMYATGRFKIHQATSGKSCTWLPSFPTL